LEKEIAKLLINANSGKLIENKEKCTSITIVLSPEKVGYYLKSPNVQQVKIINDMCALFVSKRLSYTADRPVYGGVTVLDVSKKHMFDFYYDYVYNKYISKPNTSCSLVMTDTDSLTLFITSKDSNLDPYKDMWENQHLFDMSDYNPADVQFGWLHKNEP